MRLSMKEVQKQHESTKKLYEQGLTVAPVDVKRVLDLYDTIEALQQENEQLKADCDRMLGEVQELTMEYNHFKERLQISPYGDDKIDELDEALENCKFQYKQLKQENKQLRAQAARMWEALRKTREAIQRAKENFEPYGEYEYDVRYDLEEALAEIDKAIGGKDDEKTDI